RPDRDLDRVGVPRTCVATPRPVAADRRRVLGDDTPAQRRLRPPRVPRRGRGPLPRVEHRHGGRAAAREHCRRPEPSRSRRSVPCALPRATHPSAAEPPCSVRGASRRWDRARADPVLARRDPDRRRGGRSTRRLGHRLSPVWISVLGVGAATIALKAVGPVLLGQRTLPAWLSGPVALLAPAVLAAFVITEAVGGD